jgi:hypothetical protein
MSWWDAGLLAFMIHEKDLKKRDFSKTYATILTS